MKPIRALSRWPLVVVAILLLAGCPYYPFAPANPPPPPTCDELAQQEASPENLAFETIARESAATNEQFWPESEPGLLVAVHPQEIGEIEPFIQDATATALQEVDFDQSLVVAAFSGSKSHGGWGFCITSISQQESDVILHAHLVDSPVAPAIMASNYHLIRLTRNDLSAGQVIFDLALTWHEYANPTGYRRILETTEETIVASVTQTIP